MKARLANAHGHGKRFYGDFADTRGRGVVIVVVRVTLVREIVHELAVIVVISAGDDEYGELSAIPRGCVEGSE